MKQLLRLPSSGYGVTKIALNGDLVSSCTYRSVPSKDTTLQIRSKPSFSIKDALELVCCTVCGERTTCATA
eukprot:9497486-Pyramimonas_sp.AAC.2